MTTGAMTSKFSLAIHVDIQTEICSYLNDVDRSLERVKLLKLFTPYAINRAELLEASRHLLDRYVKKTMWLIVMDHIHSFLRVTARFDCCPFLLATTVLDVEIHYKEDVYKYININNRDNKLSFGLITEKGLNPMLDMETWLEHSDEIVIAGPDRQDTVRRWSICLPRE